MKNISLIVATVIFCIVVLSASSPQPELVNPALAWRHARVTTGSVGGTGNALITITWDVPFPDTNYTPIVDILDVTTNVNGNGLFVVKMESKTASGITVRVANNTLGALTSELQVMAIHD